ncbi:hypothetical protein RLEG12_22780 [Rhizobium leguminosarum bv. trifolii CB782]|uniref:Uncharacterized protein n=1 Tax=Rhizobium hidalgonense TaxID=1538159 RepID=A0A2A6KL44_9HYPH|nr:hypothetical protein [Rhizobium hidalgonense]AHG45887.1 hypothetical protein RLEG12_22780 [Rhizobium leguminosarum bv. trifolii CB782]EJC76674.1 hypothetical protein Rleg10DRAFT_5357 [Rhizobium leguminosarum bv. trifolii WSM2012]MDR9771634.1 hypothetical protein [Rhizobium hidalgonense]PDT25596.1 hypothetical protein CO674_02035 [Rhizobium hidalgonense]PON07730.1 hypothetical protein ATY29_11470 [Rhizobium hidalgonense]
MPFLQVSFNNAKISFRAAVKAALPISEGYALKYFALYTLVCMMVGIVLLVIINQIAPFKMDKPSDQATEWSTDEAATGSTKQPDNLVVRSTPEPATERPAVRPSDQWDLRPTNQPTPGDPSGVRKGGRVGTPAQ